MANEDLLLRQMPHSLEGEQAVLGSMLIDADCVKDVMDKLRPSDFYLRQNREIFETIYSMFTYARPIDGITVCEEMQKAGTYDDQTTRSYLAQLMEITPTSANVMEYVAIVRDKALLRGVAQAAAEITAMVQEGVGEAGDILEMAEQKVYAVRRGQSAQDMVPLRQVLPDVLDRLSEMSESENHLPGLSLSLIHIFRIHAGYQVCARLVLHKCEVLISCAVDIALEGRGQLWPVFSDFDGLLTGSDLLTPLRADADKHSFFHVLLLVNSGPSAGTKPECRAGAVQFRRYPPCIFRLRRSGRTEHLSATAL